MNYEPPPPRVRAEWARAALSLKEPRSRLERFSLGVFALEAWVYPGLITAVITCKGRPVMAMSAEDGKAHGSQLVTARHNAWQQMPIYPQRYTFLTRGANDMLKWAEEGAEDGQASSSEIER